MRLFFRSSLLVPLMVVLLCVSQQGVAKKLYRWVDENGKVHFSDVVPPDQVKYKRETMNEEARVLDVVERAKTPEELEQQRRLEALRKEQEKIIAKQAASDKVLLTTYRSIDDMQKALDNKLALMDAEKRTIENSRQLLEHQLAAQRQQAANIERNAQRVPEKLLADIASTRQQIEQNIEAMARHQSVREAVETGLRADMARFEFLTQAYNTGQSNQPQQANVSAGAELGLFSCQSAAECDKAWIIASDFVNKYATTGRDVQNDRLIMSAAPFDDDDLSLSVSRLNKGDVQQLFLDLRCKDSPIGKELCGSEKAQAIRRGFVPYIQLQLSAQ